jgi:hypothetical protein
LQFLFLDTADDKETYALRPFLATSVKYSLSKSGMGKAGLQKRILQEGFFLDFLFSTNLKVLMGVVNGWDGSAYLPKPPLYED